MAKTGTRSNRNTNNRNKKVNKNRSGKGVSPKSHMKMKTRPVKGKPKNSGNPRVLDARQKLLQKKRPVVTDARDVLTKKGKILDARNKLDKLRSGGVKPQNTNVKVIGKSILQKVDRNGKISLVTNKTRARSDMNIEIQKQLGLISPSRPQMKRPPIRKPQTPRAAPLRKTIVNEMNRGLSASNPLSRDYEASLFKWVNPDMRPASHLISSLEPARQAMRDVVREELMLAKRGWSELLAPKNVRMQPSGYVDLDAVDEDEDMPMFHSNVGKITLKGSTRVSNVHSRLDSAPAQPVSHGILSQAKTKVVVPAGHRIVVSNLQPTVTEDDIKELFEDIGQLLSAKLVRSGVAEVIYKNLKDAQKAVDTYHNRQLDGQPMKCLLVNKRPFNSTAGSVKSAGILGRGSSSADGYDKLVPDISTIHKVLFQKK